MTCGWRAVAMAQASRGKSWLNMVRAKCSFAWLTVSRGQLLAIARMEPEPPQHYSSIVACVSMQPLPPLLNDLSSLWFMLEKFRLEDFQLTGFEEPIDNNLGEL